MRGIAKFVGKKIKVEYLFDGITPATSRVAPEKTCSPDEKVCVVWTLDNNRYRLEKGEGQYQQFLRKGSELEKGEFGHSTPIVREDTFGVLSAIQPDY